MMSYHQKAVDLSTNQKRQREIKFVWNGYFDTYKGSAAEIIQRWWRGHSARLFVEAYRHGHLRSNCTTERCEELAAVVIQRFWRGLLARRQAAEIRKAAVDIQRWWKGYLARRVWPQKLRRWRFMNDDATMIQRWVRGFLARRHVARMRLAATNGGATRDRESAATTIQAFFRGYKARKHNRLGWLRQQRAKKHKYERRRMAALTIQVFWRRWKRRREARRLQEEEDRERQADFELLHRQRMLERAKEEKVEEEEEQGQAEASAAKATEGHVVEAKKNHKEKGKGVREKGIAEERRAEKKVASSEEGAPLSEVASGDNYNYDSNDGYSRRTTRAAGEAHGAAAKKSEDELAPIYFLAAQRASSLSPSLLSASFHSSDYGSDGGNSDSDPGPSSVRAKTQTRRSTCHGTEIGTAGPDLRSLPPHTSLSLSGARSLVSPASRGLPLPRDASGPALHPEASASARGAQVGHPASEGNDRAVTVTVPVPQRLEGEERDPLGVAWASALGSAAEAGQKYEHGNSPVVEGAGGQRIAPAERGGAGGTSGARFKLEIELRSIRQSDTPSVGLLERHHGATEAGGTKVLRRMSQQGEGEGEPRSRRNSLSGYETPRPTLGSSCIGGAPAVLLPRVRPLSRGSNVFGTTSSGGAGGGTLFFFQSRSQNDCSGSSSEKWKMTLQRQDGDSRLGVNINVNNAPPPENGNDCLYASATVSHVPDYDLTSVNSELSNGSPSYFNSQASGAGCAAPRKSLKNRPAYLDMLMGGIVDDDHDEDSELDLLERHTDLGLDKRNLLATYVSGSALSAVRMTRRSLACHDKFAATARKLSAAARRPSLRSGSGVMHDDSLRWSCDDGRILSASEAPEISSTVLQRAAELRSSFSSTPLTTDARSSSGLSSRHRRESKDGSITHPRFSVNANDVLPMSAAFFPESPASSSAAHAAAALHSTHWVDLVPLTVPAPAVAAHSSALYPSRAPWAPKPLRLSGSGSGFGSGSMGPATPGAAMNGARRSGDVSPTLGGGSSQLALALSTLASKPRNSNSSGSSIGGAGGGSSRRAPPPSLSVGLPSPSPSSTPSPSGQSSACASLSSSWSRSSQNSAASTLTRSVSSSVSGTTAFCSAGFRPEKYSGAAAPSGSGGLGSGSGFGLLRNPEMSAGGVPEPLPSWNSGRIPTNQAVKATIDVSRGALSQDPVPVGFWGVADVVRFVPSCPVGQALRTRQSIASISSLRRDSGVGLGAAQNKSSLSSDVAIDVVAQSS